MKDDESLADIVSKATLQTGTHVVRYFAGGASKWSFKKFPISDQVCRGSTSAA